MMKQCFIVAHGSRYKLFLLVCFGKIEANVGVPKIPRARNVRMAPDAVIEIQGEPHLKLPQNMNGKINQQTKDLAYLAF
uniref:Uncharacterized protein n=1 Tax=Kalanchoe fedtschenkoi TaxID=63787 RepID=A0A7N0VK98_KALFE